MYTHYITIRSTKIAGQLDCKSGHVKEGAIIVLKIPKIQSKKDNWRMVKRDWVRDQGLLSTQNTEA